MSGNLMPDAMLAALAIEHGVTLYSTDTDFAKFRELRWENPLGDYGVDRANFYALTAFRVRHRTTAGKAAGVSESV